MSVFPPIQHVAITVTILWKLRLRKTTVHIDPPLSVGIVEETGTTVSLYYGIKVSIVFHGIMHSVGSSRRGASRV